MKLLYRQIISYNKILLLYVSHFVWLICTSFEEIISLCIMWTCKSHRNKLAFANAIIECRNRVALLGQKSAFLAWINSFRKQLISTCMRTSNRQTARLQRNNPIRIEIKKIIWTFLIPLLYVWCYSQ